MIKIINNVLYILKIVLLLITFVFSFYIIINMYQRLEKNMVDAIFNFIPFIILFILFSINFVFKQKTVSECLFYNITCCLTFIMLLFCIYRSFNDQNMIAIIRLGYNINFNYFADIIAPMRAMLYILSVCNVFLMLEDFHYVPKKPVVIEHTDLNKKVIKGEMNGVNVVEFSDSSNN